MATLLLCPSCRGEVQVPDSLLGQRVRCPSCRLLFQSNLDATATLLPSPEATESAPDPLEETSGSIAEQPAAGGPPGDVRVLGDPRGEFFACGFCAEII